MEDEDEAWKAKYPILAAIVDVIGGEYWAADPRYGPLPAVYIDEWIDDLDAVEVKLAERLALKPLREE